MFSLVKHYYMYTKKEKLIHPEYSGLSDAAIDQYIRNVCIPTITVERRHSAEMSRNIVWYNTGRRIPIIVMGYIFGCVCGCVLVIKILSWMLSYVPK